MSKKNSSDTIGNGNRELPASSAVPQPTACVVTVRSLIPTPCPSKPAPETAGVESELRTNLPNGAYFAKTNTFGGVGTIPGVLAVRFRVRVPTSCSCSMTRDTYDVYHFETRQRHCSLMALQQWWYCPTGK
jgi:hypothetical protein